MLISVIFTNNNGDTMMFNAFFNNVIYKTTLFVIFYREFYKNQF